MSLTLILLAGLASQEASVAPPQPRILNPVWARQIREDAKARAFRDFHEPVEVALSCRVVESGSLHDCEVRSATPERAGPVAVALTENARLRLPDGSEGATLGGTVVFTIRWRPDDE